jgi:hypothetical protein
MSNPTNSTTGIPSHSIVDLEGKIIPRSIIPGYVALSFLVSFVGAWTALELISRRTAMGGHYNW